MPEKKNNICIDCGKPCTRRALRCARCKMLKLHKDNPGLVHKMNKSRMKPGWKEQTSRKIKEFFSDPLNKSRWFESIKSRPKRYGEDAPNWKGGLSTINEILRGRKEYEIWRKSVFERDNYTCQKCGYRGKNLHAHHKIEWSKDESKRFDISNGLTLCGDCHKKEHGKYIRNIDKYSRTVCPLCGGLKMRRAVTCRKCKDRHHSRKALDLSKL